MSRKFGRDCTLLILGGFAGEALYLWLGLPAAVVVIVVAAAVGVVGIHLFGVREARHDLPVSARPFNPEEQQ